MKNHFCQQKKWMIELSVYNISLYIQIHINRIIILCYLMKIKLNMKHEMILWWLNSPIIVSFFPGNSSAIQQSKNFIFFFWCRVLFMFDLIIQIIIENTNCMMTVISIIELSEMFLLIHDPVLPFHIYLI